MEISLRKLSYFLTIAQQGSFSRAANYLYLTQPSLSRQISSLEESLGASLFIRTAKGIELTAEGKYLREHIETIFSLLAQIPEGLHSAAESRVAVRIGIPPGLPDDWALDVFRQLEDQIPRVSVSLYEASTEEQRLMLQSGLLDFGLVHTDPDEFSSQLLFRQALGVAISDRSPLAHQKQIFFTDLDGHLIMSHSDGEIAKNEARWRSAAENAEVNIHWVFRKFSQHSFLIAELSNVDGVLITESSAKQNLQGWKWLPIENRETLEIDNQVGTWLAWAADTEEKFADVKSFLIEKPIYS